MSFEAVRIYSISTVDLPFYGKAAIAIGTFDGLHLGHQSILKRLEEVASLNQLIPVVLSYKKHPSALFRPDQPTQLISSLEHKLRLFASFGVKHLFLVDFDAAFAVQSPKQFLLWLQRTTSFSYLQMGHDGRLGKDRAGNQEVLQQLASEMGFIVEYSQPTFWCEKIISSTLVREKIKEGDLEAFQQLTGRAYSIYAQVERGAGLGSSIGFPTLNLSVDGLVLPPLGVYQVEVQLSDARVIIAIANLGKAPTLQNQRAIKLEVHLLESHSLEQGKPLEAAIEVFFIRKIRPELHFSSKEELIEQIRRDIAQIRG